MRGNRWRLGWDFRRDAMSIGNTFRCQVRVSNAGTGEAGVGSSERRDDWVVWGIGSRPADRRSEGPSQRAPPETSQ